MNTPLISIIIPTYNRAQLIKETLDSILGQTYANWECIIVDDGSTDTTLVTLENYCNKDSRFQFYSRPKNRVKGANACRNYGYSKSKGEFIQWFDSDDIMHTNHLEEKMKVFEQNPNLDFVVCNYKSFLVDFNEANISEARNNSIKTNLYQDYILGTFSILMINPTWRRKIFETYGVFDENLQQSQDLDLYSKIIFDNKNMHYLNEALIFVRNENDSISTKSKKQNYKLDSFLTVKERIIERTPDNKAIVNSVINMVLAVMRNKMAEREYVGSRKCLSFVKKHSSKLSVLKQLSFFKIGIFYLLFKTIKKGDTQFKGLLKL